MQLVIDISENAYKHIREYYEKNEVVEATYSYIYHGTPLPKGHGRLIDVKSILDCECKNNFSECDTCIHDDLCEIVNNASTIIEADKE